MTDSSNPNTTDTKKSHLFEDISVVQVTATALAAVTSMLLANYIGIAGSVIGVALASVVSTTAASLYKHFLRESAKRIKHIPVVGKHDETIGDAIHEKIEKIEDHTKHTEKANGKASEDDAKDPEEDTKDVSSQSQRAESTEHENDVSSHRMTTNETDNVDATIPLDELSVQSAALSIPIDSIEHGNIDDAKIDVMEPINGVDESIDSTDHDETEGSKDEDHDEKELHDALDHQRKVKRGLIIVTVISALITVALSAIVIYVASEGEGIGTKPETIFVDDSHKTSSSQSDSNYAFNKDSSDEDSSDTDSNDTNSTSSSSSSSSNASSSSNSSSSSADTHSSSTNVQSSSTSSSSSDASSSSSSNENSSDSTTNDNQNNMSGNGGS